MSKRILFFGNERVATGTTTTAPTLRALIEAGYDVAAVIVAQGEIAKSRKDRELEIATVAEQHGIPLITPNKLKDAKDTLAKFEAEAAVLVAFGKIIPQAIIDIFPRGIINIHPSLLPLHRGSTPLESVIRNGDKETGVSLMRLSAEMDAGPVYAQETVLLHGDETKQQLADQLIEIGKSMLLHYLPDILAGKLEPSEQSESEATYDKLVTKDDGNLGFMHKSAEELERDVRAYAGWPRSRTTIGTTDVVITEAHAGQADGTPGTLWLEDASLGIYAKSGVLVVDSLIPSGKKEMPAKAFLAGYKP
jgi:methionyl-tRNA formyltransferase